MRLLDAVFAGGFKLLHQILPAELEIPQAFAEQAARVGGADRRNGLDAPVRLRSEGNVAARCTDAQGADAGFVNVAEG